MDTHQNCIVQLSRRRDGGAAAAALPVSSRVGGREGGGRARVHALSRSVARKLICDRLRTWLVYAAVNKFPGGSSRGRRRRDRRRVTRYCPTLRGTHRDAAYIMHRVLT